MTARQAVFLQCLLAALVVPMGTTRAAQPASPKPTVWIEPISDSGGAGERMGGETLARRFTQGLRAALEAEAHERFAIRTVPRPMTAAESTVRFVLRGGLSRVQETNTNVSENRRPYLCIVRLFQETLQPGRPGVTRRLVGQWSGTARGLRDLTGNLARDPRVHAFGLAGELSRRVRVTVVQFADSADSAPKPPAEDSPAVVVLDGGAVDSPAK